MKNRWIKGYLVKYSKINKMTHLDFQVSQVSLIWNMFYLVLEFISCKITKYREGSNHKKQSTKVECSRQNIQKIKINSKCKHFERIIIYYVFFIIVDTFCV